jgi:hypothetical protein
MVGGFSVAMSPSFCEQGTGVAGRADRRTSLLFVLGLASAVALSTGSCSFLVDADRQQCTIDQECQNGDPANADAVCMEGVCQPNPTWACLGAVTWPAPDPKPARIVLQLRDLVSEQPVSGITARVCRKLDYDCLQPLQSGLVGDASGNLTIDTTVGFDGYVELRVKERMPGIYFFYPPVTGDREIPNVPMIKETELFQFASLAGKPISQGRGHVMLGAYDCLGRPAEGVSLSSTDGDSQTSAFYSVKKVPSTTAVGTDSSGRGGLINIKAGSITVTGKIADGREVANVGLFVRNASITYTTMLPAPR